MPSNKNQHFVPRCYLRPFCIAPESEAIALWNFSRPKYIPQAPLKNQCSGDYFYGQDANLEEAIQSLEAGYTRVRNEISKSQFVSPSNGQKQILQMFCLLQYLRTEGASRRMAEMSEDLARGAKIPESEQQLGIKEAVIESMRIFSKGLDSISDLDVCFVVNSTDVPFITCDDPAILTNRFYNTDRRVIHTSYGMMSSGNIFILPLSPKLLLMCYDNDVYSIPHTNSWIKIRRRTDVVALNSHQFLNCRNNIFCIDQKGSSLCAHEFQRLKSKRTDVRHRINYAVADSRTTDYTRYRSVTRAEAWTHDSALMHIENIRPRPGVWPRFLRWKRKGIAYYNGSAVGYIRAAAAREENNMHSYKAFSTYQK